MSKLIQICASTNDLFGLDGDGIVYHYNFNTNDWIRLGSGRRDRGGRPPVGGEGDPSHADIRESSSRSPSGGSSARRLR